MKKFTPPRRSPFSGKVTWAVLFAAALAALVAVFIFPYTGAAQTAPSGATVATDKPDYPPLGLVTITGGGFTPGEVVVVQIVHLGEGIDDDLWNPAHFPWEVMADATGAISTSWVVPDSGYEVGATLLLTAYGSTSGRLASTTFTDAAKIRVDVTPTYVDLPASTPITFSVLVQNVSNGNSADKVIRHIRITLPPTLTINSVASATFSPGRTWNAPTLAGQVVTVRTPGNADSNQLLDTHLEVASCTSNAGGGRNDVQLRPFRVEELVRVCIAR